MSNLHTNNSRQKIFKGVIYLKKKRLAKELIELKTKTKTKIEIEIIVNKTKLNKKLPNKILKLSNFITP